MTKSTDSDFGLYLHRRDASFIATYSTNMSIIQGISIAFAADKFLVVFSPVFTLGQIAIDDWQNLLAFVCTIVVFAWVAVEYYWFMTVVRRRPVPRDTVVQFALGAVQCLLGLSVGRFNQWVFCLVLLCSVGLIAHLNSLINLRQAENADRIKNYAKKSIARHAGYVAVALVVVIGCYALERQAVINRFSVFAIFAAVSIACLSLIVSSSSRSFKNIEKLAAEGGWASLSSPEIRPKSRRAT